MEAIERSIRILEELSGYGEGLGVVRISKETGMPAATAHRLLAALVKHNLVVQEQDSGQYRLGPRILSWTQRYLDRNDLITASRPHLARLSSETNETVFLTTLLGGDAVCVSIVETPRPLRFFIHIGQRMPYHAAASARAILAFRPAEEAERLLRSESLNGFTASTPTTVESVTQGLSQIRNDGYAVCDEELEIGVTAISAPVHSITGEVVASITVVAPSERLSGTRRTVFVSSVVHAASVVSELMGHLPSHEPLSEHESVSSRRAVSAVGLSEGV